ncbi:VWA domain-containing protein [Candidatus Obscuribacterales bacterium]|nr:VWA domain-containing protein [Candidatus Obscuribacterales bacterium]MBX3149312.1 VWA domain-containing protein [Candidatus Obscuribacterales bacterium]
MRSKIRRNQRGALIILMCFVLGLVALPMIGLLTFEVSRAMAIREQLRSDCQAAALAGAARLASSDNTDTLQTHQDVVAAAVQAFRANSINEYTLTGAHQVQTTSDNPAKNEASIYVRLLDPNSSPPNQPVELGNPNGRIVQVVGAFGLTPAFGTFLGITGPYTLRSEGLGRVPQLDIVLCFDVSASIDDQSPVTFVRRYWNSAQGRIRHLIINARPGAPTTGGLASGKLYDIIGPQPTGSSLNAHYPQSLEQANTSGHSRPLSFNAALRGTPNTGSPPGNYPSGNSGSTYDFTDLVINIGEGPNGAAQYPYTSPAGYVYPNIETVVEAARGNLEDALTFNNARLNTVSELSGVSPRPGYQADYNSNAKKKRRPLVDAQDAAKDFFTIMNNNTEAHFGFVSFSTDAGTTAGETIGAPIISSSYAGGNANYSRPGITLNETATKYTEILGVIPTTVAYGSTNIGDALLKAKDMLVAHKRPGAKRAIVLFTDGQPTAPGSGNTPWSHARSIAQQIKNEGMPIYTIGLAQTSAIIPGECNILNDDPSKSVSYTDQNGITQSYTPGGGNPGVSYIAGNGGKFFLVTSTANLRYTFENIARQLVQLVAIEN